MITALVGLVLMVLVTGQAFAQSEVLCTPAAAEEGAVRLCYGNVIAFGGSGAYLDAIAADHPLEKQTWQPMAYGRPEVFWNGAWAHVVDNSSSSGSFFGTGVRGSIFIGGKDLTGLVYACRMAGFPDPDREAARIFGEFGYKPNMSAFGAPARNYDHLSVGRCPDPSKGPFSSYNPKNILQECQATRSARATLPAQTNVVQHCPAVGDPDDETALTVEISELEETDLEEATFKVTFNKEAFVNHWMLEDALTVTNGELVSINRMRASNIHWEGTVRMTGGPVTVELSCEDLVDEDAMPAVTCVEPSMETMEQVPVTVRATDIPPYHCGLGGGLTPGLSTFNLFFSEEIAGLTPAGLTENFFSVNTAGNGQNLETPPVIESFTRLDADSNIGWEVTVSQNQSIDFCAYDHLVPDESYCPGPPDVILTHHTAGAVCASRRTVCTEDGRTIEEDLVVVVPTPTAAQYCDTCAPEARVCELLGLTS